MKARKEPLDHAVLDFLTGLKRQGVMLGLERMRSFAQTLGNPQFQVPVIHVAGTNGKGSVAAMLEAILRAAGWRTGLYTSPHLVRLGERIQVNREPLSDEGLAAYVDELRPGVEAMVATGVADAAPSYFEFMTGLAFLHFARSSCDIAIVEVGMGGRLDATNIVVPEVSVITSIGLDHCEYLGTTISAIAAEKAGIIKRGRPVVIGRIAAEAEHAIRAVAAVQGSPVLSVAEVFGRSIEQYPSTNLDGDYQRVNAATATLAARQMAPRWGLVDGLIARALSAVDWAGRWQRLSVGGRTVIVDASHNAEGAVALEGCLARLQADTGQAPLVLTGVLGAARAKPLLEAICRHARMVYLVVPQQARACSFEKLEALIPPDFKGTISRTTVAEAFPAPGVCDLGEGDLRAVVVTGSIYLAGEVLARIDPNRGQVESALQDF